MKRAGVWMLLVCMALIGLAIPAGASEGSEATVLVKFRPGVSDAARADAVRDADGRRVRRLGFIGVDVLRVEGEAADAVSRLRDDPRVVYAERNIRQRALASVPNDPSFGKQWNMSQGNDADVDAPEGWAAAHGTDASGNTLFPTKLTGPKIGIIDTGIDADHPDLLGKLAGCASALSGLGLIASGCEDDNGHGTHVAGIAAALTNNGKGVAGTAPHATIVMCKALNSAGVGFVADINACMNWLAGQGVSVISMSLGGAKTSTQQDAVNKIWNGGAGTLMVAAAGNDGNSTVSYPAGYAEVVSVASTTNSDSQSSFSNENPDVEVAAPGSSILSTYLGGTYATASGTSMATPHAAGVAAMITAEKGLTGQGLRDALVAAVDDLGASGRDIYFGYGRVNLAKAVGDGGEPPPPPPEEDTGDVAGSVNMNRTSPIAGAAVSWSGPESGSTTTDGAGAYLASGLTPGTYTFTASASGCTSRSAQVAVSGGATTTQDFRLRC